ncbi:MAG TPA: winged helix-turn-helix domain-containing protein [bacterium]|nr:winged helix-turn-helix domain-containing protein [bacterium]
MIKKIGESAGVVWKALNINGETTLSKLQAKTRLSRDLLHQAIGWLAREGKLEMQKEKRTTRVFLK